MFACVCIATCTRQKFRASVQPGKEKDHQNGSKCSLLITLSSGSNRIVTALLMNFTKEKQKAPSEKRERGIALTS